jgi:hypothetical protein
MHCVRHEKIGQGSRTLISLFKRHHLQPNWVLRSVLQKQLVLLARLSPLFAIR